MLAGFLLGIIFWQYKNEIYCRIYDWWHGKDKPVAKTTKKKPKKSTKKTRKPL